MELSPYYEKKIECLCCKKTFPTYKVRSKSIKVDHTDTDFCPIYSDSNVNALFYNIFVCEHCGFSFTEDFSKYFAPGTREVIEEQITKKWVPRSFNGERTIDQAIESYKLAFVSGMLKKEKAVSLAGLALRIGWLYRSLKNEQENRFIKIARDQYIESFSTEDYKGTQMSDTRIMYMIAELSRRIGDLDDATRFFSKVIESQRIDGGEAKLVDLAKEQWQLVREQREKERSAI
ncbi:DUF2225 domain-containing protein [Lysinibacillus telephonicus]|uniref:DUF2225 domain-containing protein n=1 Tax=Lysinibacillus telephonicus TaxID=1714840 RepID=A0A431URY7_9BACI|nr:DUF2225 domain-containing protein [Lysinibacillus telephonicus]RTQ93076.1 DUF2225 domain-containing protein [Lysinibacillus telephonicus]